MTTKGGGLRPEARSVYVDKLSPDQERAFDVLVGLLETALSDLPGDDEWAQDPLARGPSLGRATSRVLLLDGGPGSGKTTVATTLRAALTQKTGIFTETAAQREDAGDSESKDEGSRSGQRKELANRVDSLRRHVIVLEPLSVEQSPSGTNLLAAVLARIEARLFPDLTHEDVPQTTADHRHHSSVLELLRLQTDVAIAWNGNLNERKGELDPDNYAMEELRVERVRLQLRDRFESVLRRTARDSLRHEQAAFFLLIVDDADVNPSQLVEIVERLRMVGVAELVVLLLGSSETMEDAFRLHFADRFRLSARSAVDPLSIGKQVPEMAAATNALARSALRRHIPYLQRVQLVPLLARDAVRMKPFGAAAEFGDLGQMLQRAEVSYPAHPHVHECAPGEEAGDGRGDATRSMSLSEFIYPIKRGAKNFDDQSWYVGSRTLADSPRVMVDLWSTLEAEARWTLPRDPWDEGLSEQERGAKDLDARLHLLFRRLAAERLDAKSGWGRGGSPVNDALREAIIRDGSLRPLKLTVRHTCNLDDEMVRMAEGVRDDPDPVIVHWTRHRGLRFRVAGQRTSRREIGPAVLVEDLWALENRGAAQRSTAIASRGRLHWVVNQFMRDEADESIGSGGEMGAEKGATTEPWQIPRYRTIRQVEQFGYVWNSFLDRFAEREPSVQQLVDAWSVIHTETLLGFGPMVVHANDASDELPKFCAEEPAGSEEVPGDDQYYVSWHDRIARQGRLRAGLMNFRGRPGDWSALVATKWLHDLDHLTRRRGPAV